MIESKKKIYLDYAAATPVRPEVLAVMHPFFSQEYANPSSQHAAGINAQKSLQQAREKIKNALNAEYPEEIIFTSSGTESINLAIAGIARANKNKGKHIITTKIEHKAVLETCQYLSKNENFNITYLNVNKEGIISLEELQQAIRSDTILVSVMYVNNELGSIQPIEEIAQIAKKHHILFYADACQASYLNLNVHHLGIDALTLNSSKIFGPKGSAILYLKKGTLLHPIIHGGGQEFTFRSGTENLPAIIGFAKALELISQEKEQEILRQINLQNKLLQELKTKIPEIIINGPQYQKIPNIINISFPHLEGEQIMRYLNQHNIYISSGSACTSKEITTSHVLQAIGLPENIAKGTIRISFGKYTLEEEINKLIEILPNIIKTLTKISG
ncbi:cysteine desulfurase [Candidatus Woesearchaeota archaeon]|nr:cysteine desulfurase [Candidatus Woesearchaeota archaeon]